MGSPKKPPPTKKVVIFMNMDDDVRSAIATAGTSIPASLSRAASLGNGGAGDRALGEHVSTAL